MLIAITGATGFVGRYIANQVIEQGHTVRAWHREGSDRGGFVDDKAIEWLGGALNDPDSTQRLVKGVDAVVHSALGGGASPGAGEEDEMIASVLTNVLGSLRLMRAAEAQGVGRFVFISTCAVHERILDDRPLDEAHVLWPYGHYGAYKAAVEKFVHSFGLAEKRWGICALRPTGVYGLRRPAENSAWHGLIQRVWLLQEQVR